MTVEDRLDSPGLDRPGLTENPSVEDADDAFHEVRQHDDRGHQWFSLRNPLLAERYLKRKVVLVVEFTTRRLTSLVGGDSEHYRAVFKREHRISRFRDTGNPNLNSWEIRREVNSRKVGTDYKVGDVAVVRGPYRHDQVVLVEDIESVEPPKRGTPSLVWLERPQYADRPFVGSTYFSNVAGYKFLLGVANREARRPCNRAVPIENDLFGEMVEARPEVVEDVAKNDPPGVGDLLSDADAIDCVSRLWVYLSNDRIWVGVEESPDFTSEVIDVLFGPIDL